MTKEDTKDSRRLAESMLQLAQECVDRGMSPEQAARLIQELLCAAFESQGEKE